MGSIEHNALFYNDYLVSIFKAKIEDRPSDFNSLYPFLDLAFLSVPKTSDRLLSPE
jgi:hypothetical protein